MRGWDCGGFVAGGSGVWRTVDWLWKMGYRGLVVNAVDWLWKVGILVVVWRDWGLGLGLLLKGEREGGRG